MATEVKGIDQALAVLAEYPINADKVVKAAMREAAKTAAQAIRPKMPNKTFRKAVGYTVKEGVEYTFANVGILRSKKEKNVRMRNGKEVPRPWLRAYWKNYGTLANRDPSHKFAMARKSKSSGWKGGIRPAHFFEPALVGVDKIMEQKFEETFIKKMKERKLIDEQQ